MLDGTEVLAIFLSKKTNATIGDIIAVINIMIFSAAAYFLSIESALYSMLTYISASKTVDYIIEGIEEYTGVTIISKKMKRSGKLLLKNLDGVLQNTRAQVALESVDIQAWI